jgi:dCTP deaminase
MQDDGSASGGPPSNVLEFNTGVLPYERIMAMVRARTIEAIPEIEPDQIQPASLDLRLGRLAYRVPASFLPGAKATVMQRVQELDGFPIDLENGGVLEKNNVYVV